MQNPLKMLGDLNKMRSQAAQIQKQLEAEVFTIEQGRIKVEINGNQKILNVFIDGQPVGELTEILNQAITKSQQAAAAKLASISQALGLGQ
jgi:DNA-binding protein YbaB